ncbi:MAG: tetratricopeptide repeat protein [Longimicrobiales bacterium]
MGIESLKQQARNHEQNAEWQSALDQYTEVLAELAGDEQVDIGLHHRMGDLYVRVGGLDQAVEHYVKAVELYREAYLPNNAIAVCKKIIRHVPQHHGAYLLMGRIRGEQGFLPEARENFLAYADCMASDGDMDESVRALIEFCDLAPDDVDARVMLAEQMVAQGREEEAAEHLRVAHRHYEHIGDAQQAEDMKARIVAIGGTTVEETSPELEDTSDEDDFVDLGAMILGGMAEKSTHFKVSCEEPSGDEQADFATVLAQFEDKVSENLDSNDVQTHHDLGTAYKNMGLLDEAIGSFQAALRASADHLPTYELLGQTFLEMGRPEAAVKSMERAFEVATAGEEELVGIYYYLGLAYTKLNSRQTVME